MTSITLLNWWLTTEHGIQLQYLSFKHIQFHQVFLSLSQYVNVPFRSISMHEIWFSGSRTFLPVCQRERLYDMCIRQDINHKYGSIQFASILILCLSLPLCTAHTRYNHILCIWVLCLWFVFVFFLLVSCCSLVVSHVLFVVVLLFSLFAQHHASYTWTLFLCVLFIHRLIRS